MSKNILTFLSWKESQVKICTINLKEVVKIMLTSKSYPWYVLDTQDHELCIMHMNDHLKSDSQKYSTCDTHQCHYSISHYLK